MRSYRILWLDDDFLPFVPSPSQDELSTNDTREAFQQDVRLLRDDGFIIEGVPNYTQFCEKLRQSDGYNAVILDLMGLDNENIDHYYVAGDALEVAEKLKLPVYVYSANVTEDDSDFDDKYVPSAVLRFDGIIRKIKKAGRAFYKGLGINRLREQLRIDLDNEYYCFEGHEECLSLLNKGYLKSELAKEMTNVLKSCKDSSIESLPLNDIRKLMENMLQTLHDEGEIKDEEIKRIKRRNIGVFNERIFYISEFCHDDEKGKTDYDNPYFPYSKCRQEIKTILSFLGQMTQEESHYNNSKKVVPEYLLQGETQQIYNKPIKDCVSQAFFIVMKWYYGFMERFHQKEQHP